MSDAIDERLTASRKTATPGDNAGSQPPPRAPVSSTPASPSSSSTGHPITTSGDSERAVDAFAEQHPFMRPEQITPEEQKRRWGQEILDAIGRA